MPTITAERLGPLSFCFTGFAPGDKPILHVFAPGAGRTDWPGSWDPMVKNWSWYWSAKETVAMAPHPGTYPFTITAADTPVTRGLIMVRPATEPGMVSSNNYTVRRGDQVAVTVVGRKPGSRILASLYGSERNDRLRLLDDLPAVTADPYGEGVIRWTATNRIAPGRYVIYLESTHPTHHCSSSSCDAFRVDR